MSFEASTATDHLDLLARVQTFLTATISPVGERWTTERYTGIDLVHFSSELGGFEAALAFNGSNSDGWLTALAAATPSQLGGRFVSGVDIRRLAITSHPNSGQKKANQAPNAFDLEYSDNGTAWTLLESFNAGTFDETERKVFDVSAASPGNRVWWRINVSTNGGNTDHTGLSVLELYDDVSGELLNVGTEPELVVRGPGLAAADQVYVGLKVYSLATSDIYNAKIAGFTGFAPASDFDAQPGASVEIGLPLWNQAIPYWINGNGRRFGLVAKVETTYQTAYGGLALPYATPGQWPYPLAVAGILPGAPLTRYSDAGNIGPWTFTSGGSSRLQVRDPSGVWITPECWPWLSSAIIQDTPGGYSIDPIILADANNVYGELDGLAHVSGFGNAVENTVDIAGPNWLCVLDVYRTGVEDYHALELA